MRVMVLSLVITLFIINFNIVLAENSKSIEEQIGQSSIHPASFFYFLKMLREQMEMQASQTPSVKLSRYLEFSTRRIREVRGLVFAGREDLIDTTLERYWTHLHDLLAASNGSDHRTKSEIENQVYQHLYILNAIYPSLTNKMAKVGIRRTIYKIYNWNRDFDKKLTAPGQRIACNFLSHEATLSALNQVEKGVIIERAQKCNQDLSTER